MKTLLIALVSVLILSGCKKDNAGFANNPNIPDNLHNRSVGASANELLSATKYKSVKIEIQYMGSYVPDAAAVSNLQSWLGGLLNKPSGISVVTKQISTSTATKLSVNDLLNIERNNRTAFTTDDQLAVYILYANVNYTEDNVLGVAYRNTSVTLFGKKIHDNSGGLGQASRTKLETTVLEHELAHLLGLVDLGSAMQTAHKDGAHGNHCSNTNCLMYYASETTDILGFLVTGSIPSLDANCKADLHANGGQ